MTSDTLSWEIDMSIQSILNSFGDVVVSTIEKNALLKTQLGAAVRQGVYYFAGGFATQGYITNDNSLMYASIVIAALTAVYGQLKTRALRRENIAVVNTSANVNEGDTLPAEAAMPEGEVK